MTFIKFYEKYHNISNDLGELFNIYLVLNGGRKAYLSEYVNIKELLTIKDQFSKKLYFTPDPYGRTYIHRDKLPSGNLDDDIWVAQILGFDCLGIPDLEDSINYIITYKINDSEFIAFICDNPDKIVNKTKYFQKFAGSQFKITLEIKKFIPMKHFAQAILDKNINFLEENKREFYDIFLENCKATIMFNFTENIEELFKICYEWLLWFAIQTLTYNPLEILEPLTLEEYELYQNELNKLLCKHNPQFVKWNKFSNKNKNDTTIIEYISRCKDFNQFYKRNKNTYLVKK